MEGWCRRLRDDATYGIGTMSGVRRSLNLNNAE